MRPDVVTFWHGPLDALRLTCLSSQVAAGHKVTGLQFRADRAIARWRRQCRSRSDPAACILRKAASAAAGWHVARLDVLQFSDFFRMRLMARGAGLWLDADVLLLKRSRSIPAKPYFAWERPAPARKLRSVFAVT
jgi:hypothetical protein